MYNAKLHPEMFNDIAQYAILATLFYDIWESRGGGTLDIKGKHYDDPTVFAKDFKNKPETVSVILKQFQIDLMYFMADSDSKPLNWTVEEYWDWFGRTFAFICDKKVSAPVGGTGGFIAFDEKYNKDSKSFKRIELILDQCFELLACDDEYCGVYIDCLSEIVDGNTFSSACHKMLEHYAIDKEQQDFYINILIEEVEDLYEVAKVNGRSIEKVEFYESVFSTYFDFDNVVETYMFEDNFKKYYDGCDDKDIYKD